MKLAKLLGQASSAQGSLSAKLSRSDSGAEQLTVDSSGHLEIPGFVNKQFSEQPKPLSADAERTCQPVVRHVEDSQIGKVAKLLGKAAYRKKGDYQHKTTRSDRVTTTVARAFKAHVVQLEDLELGEYCNLWRNATAELVPAEVEFLER